MKDTDKALVKELLRRDISREDISVTRNILETCPDVADTLSNPLVTYDEKHNIIKQLFPESLERFMSTVIRDGAVGELNEIFDEYEEILLEKQGSIKAVVRYVTPLTESQQADLRKFIMEKFVKDDVDIEYRHDPDIIGGFILNAGDVEYDRSYRTSLRAMRDLMQTKAAEVAESGKEKLSSCL